MIQEMINDNVISFIILLLAIGIWDTSWKLIAAWKACKRGSKTWFILLLIINSVGLLPILYIIFSKNKVKKEG